MFPNSHQDFLPREILEEKGLKISFSQNGEDGFITSYFWLDILNRKVGSYLDIGCFNEAIFSNTKLLSLVGWHGVALDANPVFEKPWKKARPNDVFINTCIQTSDNKEEKNEHTNFYLFKNRQNSTSDKKRAKDLIKRGSELLDIITVPTITLPKLAKNINSLFDNGLDFLSIDLEYLDYFYDLEETLKILKPRLICLETIDKEINIENLMKSREVKIIESCDYKVLYLTGDNILASYKGIFNIK